GQCDQRTKSESAHLEVQDRLPGIRCHDSSCSTADDRGPEPDPSQDNWRHDYLHEGRCLGARRFSPADEYRTGKRAAFSIADDPKSGERVHFECDLGHQDSSTSNQDDGATPVTNLATSGSVDFCSW